MPESTSHLYTDRLSHATERRDDAHKRWSLLGNLRLASALIAAVAAWRCWSNDSVLWWAVLIVAIAGFVALAIMQRKEREVRDSCEAAITVNERALTRFAHRWDALPQPPDSGADRTHPYAHDLNIVGWASLAQRIGTPATKHGWTALYDSLLLNRDLNDLGRRQDAVSELAGKIDLRQSVEAVAVGSESVPDPSPLQHWSKSGNWLDDKAWLRMLALIGPALVVIAIILTAVSVVPWVVILIPVTVNAILFMSIGGPAAQAVQGIEPMRNVVAGYGRIMGVIGADTASAPHLRDLENRLDGAADSMRALGRIVNFSIPAGSMLYFPLQMTLMWDINVLDRLENWRNRHGTDVDGWLEAMGEWESLAALSVLSHDYPHWQRPVVDASRDGLMAAALHHPLLAADIAVPNDVAITPEGRFLFVTGSNMSGKSTLLRAIGVNAVLAQAGASVCAQSLSMPPLQISSCMRVEDSLAHGVSFFMAELLRLKSVVDRVRAPGDRMGLYLLDEILQGTNTAERQIASRHVLHQLTQQHAIGAVSSHDLELIGDTELEQSAITVHFAEHFTRDEGTPEMKFDYLLRPGLATSSNAIKLMEMIGFDLDE